MKTICPICKFDCLKETENDPIMAYYSEDKDCITWAKNYSSKPIECSEEMWKIVQLWVKELENETE